MIYHFYLSREIIFTLKGLKLLYIIIQSLFNIYKAINIKNLAYLSFKLLIK